YKAAPGSRKLLLVLQGGNSCANEVLCDNTENRNAFGPEAPGYAGNEDCPLEVMMAQTPADPRAADIFSDHPDNPFRDHHYVFLPYVSGDMWVGDNPHEVVFAEDASALPTSPRYRFRGREN